MRTIYLRRARKAAADVLRRYGATEMPVPVERIAGACGIAVEHGPLDGKLALLARVGDRARVCLSDQHQSAGQRRFSLAHELGHMLLGHDSNLRVCTNRSMKGLSDARDGARDLEAEANAFAADLLLPERLVRKRCEVSPVDLDVARAIARDFQTTVMAAAIRFAELTSERCAVVLSRAGRVRWAVPSDTFWPEIDRGQRVSAESLAHEYFAGRGCSDAREPVDALAWVDGTYLGRPAEIFEHAHVFPALEAVLSLVWIPESCTELTYKNQ